MAEELSLQQQIKSLMKATEESLVMKTEEQLKGIVLNIEEVNQRIQALAPKKDVELIGQLKKDVDTLNENLQKNQVFIDNFIAEQGKRTVEKKDFQNSWNDGINKTIFSQEEKEMTKMANDRNFKLTMDLKVATMLSSNAITGDVQHSYNPRQGLVPNQNWNFRDILNTTQSPTGSFVTYRETGTSGSISVQTEGELKTQIDYAFTEVKTVSKYIAGWALVSKQLMYHLPFLNNTLPRMLLRDFYKKENDYIYDAMIAAGTGSASTPTVAAGGPANDAEEMLFWIANQRTANFNASYGIVNWAQWAALMTAGRNANSGYAFPLAGQVGTTGDIMVAGTPILGASWADAGEFLLWDNSYVERVETESLNVTFSYEDSDNFRRNLVTVKVECFEELNILRPDAIIHGEFGGS
jgi:hypothetical protein